MTFDSKIAMVVREDLPVWQKLNVTAFLTSSIAADTTLIGEPYQDASGNQYSPMLIQPILIFAASPEGMRRAYQRGMGRGVRLTVYIEEMFKTGNDIDNRAAVKAVQARDLNLVGIALRDAKKTVDKVLDGLKLHP